jgi:hypothetical protein
VKKGTAMIYYDKIKMLLASFLGENIVFMAVFSNDICGLWHAISYGEHDVGSANSMSYWLCQFSTFF